MRLKWFIFIAIMMLSGCTANKQTSKGVVSQSAGVVPTGHGLWYYLPKTAIRVEITAEKRVAKAGAFFRFSQRFLNITDVITEDKEEWRIVGAKISTFGIPDEKKLFMVSTEGTPAMAALSLTQNGILKSVNTPGMKKHGFMNEKKSLPEEVISLKNISFDDVPFTEEQLIKSSTTAVAEEVAKEIYRLRQIKKQIMNGDMDLLPPDAGAYEQTFAEIEKQEKAYMSLFTGIEKKQTFTRVYEFIPESSQSPNTVLFRFSQQNGFLESMDVSGTPVYIEIEATSNNAKNYIAIEDKKAVNTTGLAVCNPGKAKVKIIDRTLLLTEQEVQLGQFGQLYRLPADLLNNNNAGVRLNETTGAVENVIIK